MVELSIIVPTYNEENYLPILLNSIKKQKYKNYEIIIADNNSKDSTVKISKKFKARIAKGGRPGKGRNNGAKIALGNLLLFMDADALLDENALEDYVNEFKRKKLELASSYIRPISNRLIDRFLHGFANFIGWACLKIFPHATGAFILCKKETFRKLNGFDETIIVGEDHELARRAENEGFRYGDLRSHKISISVRRLDAEGRFRLFFKYLGILFHRLFLGEIRNKDLYDYKYKEK